MRNSRVIDLVLLILLISGVFFFLRSGREAKVSEVPKSVEGSTEFKDAPPFTLPTLNGPEIHYDGKSAVFIVLTAMGCPDCQKRVALDEKAKALVRQYKIPVWNHLLFAEKVAVAEFVQSEAPSADAFVIDKDGAVSVKQYGGSDAQCWILINPQGKIVRIGTADLKQLEEALTRYFGKP